MSGQVTQTKQKQQELGLLWRNFQTHMCINGDSVPSYLKDIFELFIESHNSKQFLKKHEQVTDIQKRAIRQALLKACAVCGPDSQTQDSNVSTKFIDIGRIQYDDYIFEGIQICIKWYLIVLESTNFDTAQQQTKQA